MVIFRFVLSTSRINASDATTAAATDAAELYNELRARHGFTPPLERLRAAINGEFATWPAPLKDDDEIVFIPPVAGG